MQKQIERLLEGDPRALGRLISLVENGTPQASVILAEVGSHLGAPRVVGVTGPPGVGKSTLVSALISEYRQGGTSVGVVAVDPSSPLSGGAILGDRVRMAAHVADKGVFVRSVSARGHVGGLSAATAGIVDLMDAAGYGVIMVETVGAGQSEVEVAEIADCKLVVMAPGLGDDVQAIKAGILEIADILVVNKVDLPNAQQTRAQLRAMLRLRPDAGENVGVVETVAATGHGVGELAESIAATLARRDTVSRRATESGRIRRLVAAATSERVRTSLLESTDAQLESICRSVQAGELPLDAAVTRALRHLTRPDSN